MAARGAQTWNARALLYGPLRVAGAGDNQAHSALMAGQSGARLMAPRTGLFARPVSRKARGASTYEPVIRLTFVLVLPG